MLQKFCHKSPEKEKPGGAGCASALGLTSNLLRKRNNNNVNIRDFFLLWCGDFFYVMGLFRDNHTLLYTHGPPTLMMGEKSQVCKFFHSRLLFQEEGSTPKYSCVSSHVDPAIRHGTWALKHVIHS